MFCLGEAVRNLAAPCIVRVELLPDEHAAKLRPGSIKSKILTISVKRG